MEGQSSDQTIDDTIILERKPTSPHHSDSCRCAIAGVGKRDALCTGETNLPLQLQDQDGVRQCSYAIVPLLAPDLTRSEGRKEGHTTGFFFLSLPLIYAFSLFFFFSLFLFMIPPSVFAYTLSVPRRGKKVLLGEKDSIIYISQPHSTATVLLRHRWDGVLEPRLNIFLHLAS